MKRLGVRHFSGLRNSISDGLPNVRFVLRCLIRDSWSCLAEAEKRRACVQAHTLQPALRADEPASLAPGRSGGTIGLRSWGRVVVVISRHGLQLLRSADVP